MARASVGKSVDNLSSPLMTTTLEEINRLTPEKKRALLADNHSANIPRLSERRFQSVSIGAPDLHDDPLDHNDKAQADDETVGGAIEIPSEEAEV